MDRGGDASFPGDARRTSEIPWRDRRDNAKRGTDGLFKQSEETQPISPLLLTGLDVVLTRTAKLVPADPRSIWIDFASTPG